MNSQRVAIAAGEEGAGLSLVGDGSRAYVQLITGREQIVRP
jgi:hypothetical protein